MKKPRSGSEREVRELWTRVMDGAETQKGGAWVFRSGWLSTHHEEVTGAGPGDLSVRFHHMTWSSETTPQQTHRFILSSNVQ